MSDDEKNINFPKLSQIKRGVLKTSEDIEFGLLCVIRLLSKRQILINQEKA